MVSEAQLEQTAAAFIGAFKDLDTEQHMSVRAPTCRQIFAPGSLNAPPPKSNEDFAAHLTRLRDVLVHFPVTAKEIHVNITKKQVLAWATAVPEFKPELKEGIDEKDWEYQGEYMFLLDMDEDAKIVRIVEFLDSLATQRLRGLMSTARDNLAKGQRSEEDKKAWV